MNYTVQAQALSGVTELWVNLSVDGKSVIFGGEGSGVYNQSGTMTFSPTIYPGSGFQKTAYVVARLVNYPDGDTQGAGNVIGDPAVRAWEFQFE